MDTNFVTWTANTDYQQRVQLVERIPRYDVVVVSHQLGWTSRLTGQVVRLASNVLHGLERRIKHDQRVVIRKEMNLSVNEDFQA